MARNGPKLKAWDYVQDDIKNITKAGYQTGQTKHEKQLGELLDKFNASNISVDLIYALGEVVQQAYYIGKDDK
jgi:hypothetical protein